MKPEFEIVDLLNRHRVRRQFAHIVNPKNPLYTICRRRIPASEMPYVYSGDSHRDVTCRECYLRWCKHINPRAKRPLAEEDAYAFEQFCYKYNAKSVIRHIALRLYKSYGLDKAVAFLEFQTFRHAVTDDYEIVKNPTDADVKNGLYLAIIKGQYALVRRRT